MELDEINAEDFGKMTNIIGLTLAEIFYDLYKETLANSKNQDPKECFKTTEDALEILLRKNIIKFKEDTYPKDFLGDDNDDFMNGMDLMKAQDEQLRLIQEEASQVKKE